MHMQISRVSQRFEQSSYDEFGDAPSLVFFFLLDFQPHFPAVGTQTLFSDFPSQRDRGFSISVLATLHMVLTNGCLQAKKKNGKTWEIKLVLFSSSRCDSPQFPTCFGQSPLHSRSHFYILSRFYCCYLREDWPKRS